MTIFADAIGWLSAQWTRRGPRAHWGAYLDVIAATFDALVELADEARQAALPGQVGDDIAPNLGGFWSVDALPMIGRDRLIRQGLAETPADYAARLRRWRDAWSTSGACFGLLDQLAGVLSAPGQAAPVLRIVNGAGRWWTRESNGTFRFNTPAGDGFYFTPAGEAGLDTTAAHAWDWDSTTDPAPEDAGDPSRHWIIVYPPAAGEYLTSDGGAPGSVVVDAAWDHRLFGGYGGSPWAATCGSNAPISLLESIRGVVAEWRAAGFRCAYVIFAFDADAFAPDGSSTGDNPYPDGSWGHHTRHNTTTNEQEIARFADAEYCPAAPGGMTLE